MNRLRPRELGLAFLLGLCGPWALGWLVVHAFPIHFHFTQFFVSMLRDSYAWSLTEIRPYSRALYAFISSLTYGIVLGLPLGLFLNQRWYVSWLSFLVGFLSAELGLCFDTEFGIDMFLLNITLPEFWLTLVAVLAFAWVGPSMRGVRGLRVSGA